MEKEIHVVDPYQYIDEKTEKALKSYHNVSVFSIIQCALTIPLMIGQLFTENGISINDFTPLMFVVILLVNVPTIIKFIASVLGVKVKKKPSLIKASWILYIVSAVVLVIWYFLQYITFGAIVWLVYFWVIKDGYTIKKWVDSCK